MTPLDHALRLAARGFRILPLWPNSKMPCIRRWQDRATTDETQIRRWARDWPGPNANFGICTTGLLVLDVDAKNGKAGLDSLERMQDIRGQLPRTYTQRTPTGGKHIVLDAQGLDVSGVVEKLMPGIDLRAWHCQIVAAGSLIDGAQYAIEDDSRVAPAPQWLLDASRVAAVRVPSAEREPAAAELDLPGNVKRAIAYLEAREPAVQGAGGDAHTFATACQVRDLGVSEGQALELMLDYFNDRCAPPWDPDELAQKIENAFAYAQNQAAGTKTPQADFEGVPIPVAPADAPPTRPRLYFTMLKDIAPAFNQRTLVQRLLGHTAMSVVYGASNSGKTFIALDLAWAVATGCLFFGRKVERSGVAYVAAEAGRSAEIRLEALRRKHGITDAPLALVPCPVDLLRPNGDTKALIALIKEAEAAMGQPIRLIVIDTLSRVLAGGNENAPDDMGALVKHLDQIRVATQAHVMVVHHSGKNMAAGARGHSLLRAATDTEIEIHERVVRVTKQRDMDYENPWRFDLEVVTVGVGPDGEAVTSCVVVDGGPADMVAPLDGDEQRLFDALVAVLRAEDRSGNEASWRDWLVAATRAFPSDAKKCYFKTENEDDLKLLVLPTNLDVGNYRRTAFEKRVERLADNCRQKGAWQKGKRDQYLIRLPTIADNLADN